MARATEGLNERQRVVLERRGQGRGWKACELAEQVPGGSTAYGEGMTQGSEDRHQGAWRRGNGPRGEAEALPGPGTGRGGVDHVRKGHSKEHPHVVLMWQDRRVTWQRQTRCWGAPREDGDQRAGEGTRAGQQQREGEEEVAERRSGRQATQKDLELQGQPVRAEAC